MDKVKQPTWRRLAHCVVCCVVVAMFVGCGRSPYELAPVHGVVMVDDKPLFQGKVIFSPVAEGDDINPGKPAFGAIQEDGSFRLSTFATDDGAVVGQHWASIINVEEELPDGVPEFGKVTAPKRVTVVADKDNQIDIKLTREEVRKNREDDT